MRGAKDMSLLMIMGNRETFSCFDGNRSQLPTLPPQILERESSREKNLEKAVKEAKIRARREASKAAEGGIKPATQAELDLVRASHSNDSLNSYNSAALR